jgi:predicted Zn-dependent protease
MSQEPDAPTGTLEIAIQRAASLLDAEPALAAEQALAIIDAVPGHPPAILLLAAARRRSGKLIAAWELLEVLLQSHPDWAVAHYEHGLVLGELGRGDDAIRSLHRTLELKPDHPDAWQPLAGHLAAIGDMAGADAAYARHVQYSSKTLSVQQAAAAMVNNDVPMAEALLKAHLKQAPTDVPAIRMLAEVAVRCGENEEGLKLLRRCLELAPNFAAARFNYATLLHRHNDSAAALLEIERLLQADGRNPGYRNLCAVILSRIGEYDRSSQIYCELLEEYSDHAKIWLSYGHVLKTMGRQGECIDAYRQSIARDPAFGEAYWSLANLKTFRFGAADLTAISAQLADAKLSDENRLHFDFALGKLSEDSGDYAQSFEHYKRGNEQHRAGSGYDADLNEKRARRLQENYSRDFFRERAGAGAESCAPIFIIGMPRSGSTLLEQILSCHSAVEGTTELPDLITMAKDLREASDRDDIAAYVEVLASKNRDELRALGEEYIERTQVHRKTDRPFFIDKMPNNFLHTGMIHVILPNAKIIDARRHPLACCFSNFKQYYARGQSFSYDLSDMGRFYRDYVRLMAHFDTVLPNRIHRVIYERTVADTEAVVRGLLDYCGLPFEDACLRFFESDRPVRTASSEQVRQPIYQDGVEQWRHFEPWLEPLKEALGDVLSAYPAAP